MYKKADNVRRAFAFIIDIALTYLMGSIPFIGGVIGFFYMLLRDGLLDGQSIGKKLLDIRVVTDHGAVTYGDSIKRNIIFAIPSLFMTILVIGWIISGVIGAIIYIVEIVKAMNDPEGKRYGDVWAGTKVVEGQKAS
ncbi:RDD family protein [Mahella sp.]|uniref:RDD family protein n=1 Tax=Mahella sp. TaxID=2798721 RepID=UPI0025C5FAAC|nr:RDD family protein [Mahella sp.]MBZ4665331.1 domain containing protein [Mahella sp.]MDK2903610.1 hypothetical protein [Clostridiales bacterium]